VGSVGKAVGAASRFDELYNSDILNLFYHLFDLFTALRDGGCLEIIDQLHLR
jgi:hypothetical protein